MQVLLIHQQIDLVTPKLKKEYFDGTLGDINAHHWQVEVLQLGIPVDLTGATLAVKILRDDGVTVLITGTVSGNVAEAVLTQECYAVVGTVRGSMTISKDGAQVTEALCEGAITKRSSSASVVSGTPLPGLSDLITAAGVISTAEPARVTAENGRVTAEGNRVAAEGGRVTAESGRESRLVALESTTPKLPNSNTFVGKSNASGSSPGNYNTAIGFEALYNGAGSQDATAIGYKALRSNAQGTDDEGRYNTAIGYWAMVTNTTGHHNTAVGWKALAGNTTGGSNVAIGEDALLSNTTGNSSLAIGAHALYQATTGGANVAIGNMALGNNTTGYNNVGIGESAGIPAFGSVGSCTTDDRCTFVGTISGVDKSVNAGPFTNATAIGYAARVNKSNMVRLGNANVTVVESNGNFEALDIGDGFICKSPDGTRYKITVANGGTVSVAAA